MYSPHVCQCPDHMFVNVQTTCLSVSRPNVCQCPDHMFVSVQTTCLTVYRIKTTTEYWQLCHLCIAGTVHKFIQTAWLSVHRLHTVPMGLFVYRPCVYNCTDYMFICVQTTCLLCTGTYRVQTVCFSIHTDQIPVLIFVQNR